MGETNLMEETKWERLYRSLNYYGMEKGIRKLAMSAGLAPVDEIAVMPLIDICRLVTEEYEMVYISDEDIGLVKKRGYGNLSLHYPRNLTVNDFLNCT